MLRLGLVWLSLGLPVWLAGAPPGTPTALVEFAGKPLIGTERGLYTWDGVAWSLALSRGGVRDLAVGPRGALVATARGLYEWAVAEATPRFVALGAGARVRGVAVADDGAEWVATEVGAFERVAGRTEFERDASLPPIDVVAIRAVAGEVWAATRAALWVRRGGGGFEPALRGLAEGWWELCGAARQAETTLLCVPEGLWRIGAGEPKREQPALGALRRLAQGPGGSWLATERGVFALAADTAKVERAPLEGGAFAVASGADAVWVASATGVARLPLRSAAAAGVPTRELPLRSSHGRSPDVGAVQQAALDYLELSPRWIAGVEARAHRAALWPRLVAGFGVDRASSRSDDFDQAVNSGDLFQLFDRNHARDGSAEMSLDFVWELEGLAAPERAIAVSRERRELVELRDQVLERVNRMYFERLRVLERRAALAPEAHAERRELDLRVRELAAGLDAWTGGAFTRLLDLSPQTHGRPER